jgi:hypothetical protein
LGLIYTSCLSPFTLCKPLFHFFSHGILLFPGVIGMNDCHNYLVFHNALSSSGDEK